MSIDPVAEARAAVGGAFDVRVLEPAPPAVQIEPFSDDPPARGEAQPGARVISPVTDGDLTWQDRCDVQPDLAPWCAARWLAARPRLRPIAGAGAGAGAFSATRESWHALAEHVVCAARHRANGKIGLRWVRDGFGTPYFGADEQVRVTGRGFALVRDGALAHVPITTLGAAAAFVGIEPGVPAGLFEASTDGDPSRPLEVDPAAAGVLGDWYGFGTAVLAQLRVDLAAGTPSLVQLWPEHFDLAADIGDATAGRRANYGASPGDAGHPEPYLYVGPWEPERVVNDRFWNEPFGASLGYADLVASADPYDTALTFFRRGAALLGN